MTQDKEISYEMAILLKENRTLREENSELKTIIENLNRKLSDKRNERIRESEERLLEIKCDTELSEGDRVVIVDSKTDSHVIGEVYEVARCGCSVSLKKGGTKQFCLSVKKFDEVGLEKYGKGSTMSLYSDYCTWKKVSVLTPLSTRTKVVDRRWNGRDENEIWHYEFKNLLNENEIDRLTE